MATRFLGSKNTRAIVTNISAATTGLMKLSLRPPPNVTFGCTWGIALAPSAHKVMRSFRFESQQKQILVDLLSLWIGSAYTVNIFTIFLNVVKSKK